MNRIIKIIKLYYASLFRVQIYFCAAILALHLVISVAVIKLTGAPGPAGVGDIITLIYMLILGLLFFTPGFKYVLSQGISRRTFFTACLLCLFSLALVMTVLVTLSYLLNLKFANVWEIYELIYRQQNIAGMIAWEFAAALFTGMLGWFICLVYYVSSRTVKYVVSITPFVIAPFIVLGDALSGGKIGPALLSFLQTVSGFSHTSPNPYIGMTTFLVLAVLLCGPVFLLLRRAQSNE
jgi:hypothetical protein